MAEVIRENVQFVGLNSLEAMDQERVKKVIFTQFEKIEREFKQINSMRVHFKEYEKDGTRKKYSLTILVDAASRPVSASLKQQTGTWDPVAAVHDVLKKVRSELIHRFEGGTTHPRKASKRV